MFSKSLQKYGLIWRPDKDGEAATLLRATGHQYKHLNNAASGQQYGEAANDIVTSCPPFSVQEVSGLNFPDRRGSAPAVLVQMTDGDQSRGRSSTWLPGAAREARTANKTARSGIEAVEIHCDEDFTLMHPSLKAKVLFALNIDAGSSIEDLVQVGGLNVGVWTLRSAAPSARDKLIGISSLVLKLVSANREEGEFFVQMSRDQPSLMSDPMIAFPIKIIHCIGKDATKLYDLLVMPEVSGSDLGNIIGTMWWGHQGPALMQIIEKVGAALAEFHRKHDLQHGDFQPSNIFYDEAGGKITFIDLVGITSEPVPGNVGDVEHFLASLRLISQAYGPQFAEDAQRHFQSGYATLSSSD